MNLGSFSGGVLLDSPNTFGLDSPYTFGGTFRAGKPASRAAHDVQSVLQAFSACTRKGVELGEPQCQR